MFYNKDSLHQTASKWAKQLEEVFRKTWSVMRFWVLEKLATQLYHNSKTEYRVLLHGGIEIAEYSE